MPIWPKVELRKMMNIFKLMIDSSCDMTSILF